MAKNKLGIGRKFVAFSLGLLGLSGFGQSQFSQVNSFNRVQQVRNDVTAAESTKITPQSRKQSILGGGENPYKHYRKVYSNQKQYRKMLRSNPSFRNSKKCKL